jgi:hypothetical protein
LLIGKLSTVAQLLYVLGSLLLLAFETQAPRLEQAGAWITALATVLSAAAYGATFFRGILQGRRTA